MIRPQIELMKAHKPKILCAWFSPSCHSCGDSRKWFHCEWNWLKHIKRAGHWSSTLTLLRVFNHLGHQEIFMRKISPCVWGNHQAQSCISGYTEIWVWTSHKQTFLILYTVFAWCPFSSIFEDHTLFSAKRQFYRSLDRWALWLMVVGCVNSVWVKVQLSGQSLWLFLLHRRR